jgi:hypothetical protein
VDESLQKAMMNPSPSQRALLRKIRDLGEPGYEPQRREYRSLDCLLERRFVAKQGQRPGAMRFALSPIGVKFLAGGTLAELMEMIRTLDTDSGPSNPVGLAVVAPILVPDRDGWGPTITQEVLSEQMRRAEETGRQGEEAFAVWLEETGHAKQDYRWVSRDHARASFDLGVTTGCGHSTDPTCGCLPRG